MLLFLRNSYRDFSKSTNRPVMWVATRERMEETGIPNQNKEFKYTLKQTKKSLTNGMNATLVLLPRPGLQVVLLRTVQEYTEMKSMIRECRFQLRQHQSMLSDVVKNMLSCGTPALRFSHERIYRC